MEARLCQYFTRASDGLQAGAKSWRELVEEYCDNAFASVFQALGDRPWLNEADFTPVVDFGVRTLLPVSPVLSTGSSLPEEELQRTVLQAHDRAYEEQRFAAILWDHLSTLVKEPRRRKAVYDALAGAADGGEVLLRANS